MVPRELFRQELEGNKPTELGVLGLIDDAHAPATELFDYPVVGNGLAKHGVGPASGGHLRPRLQLSQCNRAIAVGLSGTVQVAERFPGVLSAATPRRAGLTVRRSRQQAEISPRAPVHIMSAGRTEWIGNDKSASHRQS